MEPRGDVGTEAFDTLDTAEFWSEVDNAEREPKTKDTHECTPRKQARLEPCDANIPDDENSDVHSNQEPLSETNSVLQNSTEKQEIKRDTRKTIRTTRRSWL